MEVTITSIIVWSLLCISFGYFGKGFLNKRFKKFDENGRHNKR